MIQISSRSILIVDFSPIWNPTTDSSRRSRFRSKIDNFWSKFDLLKDRYTDQKSRLKDQKSWLKDRNSQYNDQKSRLLSNGSIYIKKVDQNRPFLIKINLKSNFSIFLQSAGIDFVATIWNPTTNSDLKSQLNDDSNPI